MNITAGVSWRISDYQRGRGKAGGKATKMAAGIERKYQRSVSCKTRRRKSGLKTAGRAACLTPENGRITGNQPHRKTAGDGGIFGSAAGDNIAGVSRSVAWRAGGTW